MQATHPVTGEAIDVSDPLPADLLRFLRRFDEAFPAPIPEAIPDPVPGLNRRPNVDATAPCTTTEAVGPQCSNRRRPPCPL